ncbi:MAG: HAD family hydrolase [Vreelandella alkaliphila]|uniref:HAD family hydrolase n=1 Tax=Halomonadaceae TaxID=28256 RepID=UPI0018662B26|nr:HAD family phosphatase [Halomonas sp. 3A7M]
MRIHLDHDGTVVSSEQIHFQMWVHILSQYGFELSELQYKNHYAGLPTRANALDMVQRFGINASPDQLIEAKNAATQDYLASQAFPLMPGVREAIVYFHSKGLKLAVVTGASANGVQKTLQANEFEDKFSTIVSSDDVRNSKPAPECYLLALQRLGVAADECLAIEDTQHGLEAAFRAGISCLALPTEMSKQQNFHSATAVLSGMAEAVEYIRHAYGVESNSAPV